MYKIPKNFILDVDGVLTNGQMIYSSKKKEFKVFGADDNDALKILKKYIKIHFVTADKMGLDISNNRIGHMGFKLSLVESRNRSIWIEKKFGLSESIYMGDGIFDHTVMENILYSIATNNSLDHVKKSASFVTKFDGGNRAVAEACIHILKKFFKKKIKDIEIY